MIDLHMHSRYSDDGEFTPASLAEQCFVNGIRVMSVTDHNCVRANAEAQAAAEAKGIEYISGIEIDCVYENTPFHVLGYGIEVQSSDFEVIEKNVEKQSFQASLESLAATQSLGFNVTENDMLAISEGRYWARTWTGEMFAEVLLAKPEYAEHPVLRPYRSGGLCGDNPYVNFYWDYYSKGKPCYAKIEYPLMEEIIGIIHRNHGIAVLAHPGVNLKDKEYLLDGILELGMDGLEAFSSYHTPAQAEGFYQKSREKQMIATCGSDFHGKTKPSVFLGKHGCSISDETSLFNVFC